MVEENTVRAEIRTAYDTHLLMEKNIDQALKVLLNLSPLDVVLPKLSEAKPEWVGDQKSAVQKMVNNWVGMFDDTLDAGKEIPVDLIGRAAELAKGLREKKTTQ
jgi:hypothetical protein